MDVTFTIPESLASHFAAVGKDPSRAALEALAVDAYRTDELSEDEVREMLGYGTRMEVHALLKEHGVYLHYSIEDFNEDSEAMLSYTQQSIAG